MLKDRLAARSRTMLSPVEEPLLVSHPNLDWSCLKQRSQLVEIERTWTSEI